MLYRKRTGKTLANKSRIRVKPLLGYMNEISWEVSQTRFTEIRFARLLHLIAINGTQGWALLALNNPGAITDHRITNAVFRRHFENVSVPAPFDWRTFFAVSLRTGGETRLIVGPGEWFQSCLNAHHRDAAVDRAD